jgi:3-hydroxyisobutyrate dehydrogenase-like beta-hydroxyacid dehydrogenase
LTIAPPTQKQVALGPSGVVSAMAPGKAYVDMSTVDEETSVEIAKTGERAGS